MSTSISVIIPTFNEGDYIAQLLDQLVNSQFEKIIVVDGGSIDNTVEVVSQYKEVTFVKTPQKGRALQMNVGAEVANTSHLLFLHADTEVPSDFSQSLKEQVQGKEVQAGNFRLQFISTHWFLRFNARFSHFKNQAFQFGDQGLIIQKKCFQELSGFNEALLFMEGNDIIKRVKKNYTFHKLPITLKVSARKYEKLGVYRLQLSYVLIYLLAIGGMKQQKIIRMFSSIFKH